LKYVPFLSAQKKKARLFDMQYLFGPRKSMAIKALLSNNVPNLREKYCLTNTVLGYKKENKRKRK